jgi:hypothetical protein
MRHHPALVETLLELRCDRMATVRQVIGELTGTSLAGHTRPAEGSGWLRLAATRCASACWSSLNEEWEHRLYAERDLDAPQAHGT